MVVVLFGPILWYSAVYGIPLPFDYSEMGLIIAKRLFHIYSLGLIITTTVIVTIIVLIVSYIPSRRIAKMKPTDALKGKVTV
jgi:ABC-type lipoprotein release transport system permease subunit